MNHRCGSIPDHRSASIIAALFILPFLSFPRLAEGKSPEKITSPSFVPDEVHRLASRAEKAFASGDLKEAESLYRQSLEFGPANAPILISLAAVETRMGKLAESEQLLGQALHSTMNNSAAWLLLGMNYLEEKRTEEAFAALIQATLYDGRNPRAHNYLGIAAGRKGWNEASEDELRRAIELDPKYADANFNLAVLYLRRTPPLVELARRHYQQALDLGSPRDAAIETTLAKAVATPSPITSSSSVLP